MRKLLRAVPALLVAATLLVPVSPASADWSCSYYRWDEATQEWQRVALLQPADEFEATHIWGVDWHCKYNCVPAIPPKDPDDLIPDVDVTWAVEPVVSTLDGLGVPTVEELTPPGIVDPWNGPACPPGPPVWDADELDVAGRHG